MTPSLRPRAWCAAKSARACTLMLALGLAASLAPAQSTPSPTELERTRATTVRLIQALLEQGLLTRERASALLREIEGAAPSAPTPTPAAPAGQAGAGAGGGGGGDAASAVRVPFVPETVRRQLRDELRAELAEQAAREGWARPGSVPGWVRGLRVEGDLRVRLQSDRFDAQNLPQVLVAETNRSGRVVLSETPTPDRDRLRARARLGLNFDSGDGFGGGIRLTTGSSTDPLSSNQTLGTYGNRFAAQFDRAFLRWRMPLGWTGAAGRVGNPWTGTDLVWANDLSFDGLVLQWRPEAYRYWGGSFTAAAMPLQEVELSPRDKWLYGAQGNLDLRHDWLWSARLSLAYYHYAGTTGVANAPGSTLRNFTAPSFAQKGNTYFNLSGDPAVTLLGLASDYHLLNLTASFDLLTVGHKHLVMTADWVKNLGFDRAAVSRRVGLDVAPEVTGALVRASLGDRDVGEAGRWQVFLAYKHLERDAVPDAFTDSDLRGGGTDAKGYVFGGTLGLGRQTALTLRWISGDAISGPRLSQDALQIEMQSRF